MKSTIISSVCFSPSPSVCICSVMVAATVQKPWLALAQVVRGIRTEGAMAADVPLENARPAEYVFSRHVETALAAIRGRKKAPNKVAEAAE